MLPRGVSARGGHLGLLQLPQDRRLGTEVVKLFHASDFGRRHSGKLAAGFQLDRLNVLRERGADSRCYTARAQAGEARDIRTHSRALTRQSVTAPTMRGDAFVEKDGLAARRLP